MSELRPDCQVAPDVTLRAEGVRPALTPDEWAAERLDAEYRSKGVNSTRQADGTYQMDTECCGCEINPSSHHRIAALALHGQPFGFTHEQVDVLEELLRHHRGDAYWPLPDSELDEAERAIANLRALLPPRP